MKTFIEYCIAANNTRIGLPSLIILLHLHGGEKMTMTEMSKSIRQTTASMTGIADKLVNNGLVVRTIADGTDRRKLSLELTDKGKELVTKILS